MHRVATSRRHLTGVLRRRPLLDWAVTAPHGPMEQPLDDLRALLGAGDAAQDRADHDGEDERGEAAR